MRLCSIASGSSGNCIYVGSDTTHLLVDVGISGKKAEQGLNELNLNVRDVGGILITHEHSDHIGGLGVLARKLNVPIYATKGTIAAMKSCKSLGNIDNSLFCEITPDSKFMIGDIFVKSIRISHDAAEPVAYRFESEGKTAGIMTDLGTYNDYIVETVEVKKIKKKYIAKDSINQDEEYNEAIALESKIKNVLNYLNIFYQDLTFIVCLHITVYFISTLQVVNYDVLKISLNKIIKRNYLIRFDEVNHMIIIEVNNNNVYDLSFNEALKKVKKYYIN